jgi:hypothetical protein
MSRRDRGRLLTGGFVASFAFCLFQGSCLQKSLRNFISSRWPVRVDKADGGAGGGGWAKGSPGVALARGLVIAGKLESTDAILRFQCCPGVQVTHNSRKANSKIRWGPTG